MTDKNRLFEEYFDSVFKQSNVFSKAEYADHSRRYCLLYEKFLPQDKNAAILDVGCGGGHFLYFLKSRNYLNISGIDISAQQAEFCRRAVDVPVTQADAVEFLKDKPNKYDLIAAHDVLEHVPKEKVIIFLEVIYAALKPGGRLFVKTPNMGNPCAGPLRYADFTHEIGLTEKSLHQILWIAGFRDIVILPMPDCGLLNKITAGVLRFCLRKFMWYQGMVAPRVMTPVLAGVVKK